MNPKTTLYTSPSGVMAVTRTSKTVALEFHTPSGPSPLGVVVLQGMDFDKLAKEMTQFVKNFGVQPETYDTASPMLKQNLGRAVNKSIALRRKNGEGRELWNK